MPDTIGVVGVGGYLTGGGLSFLSAQYGMAADSIQEYEVVWANATIGTVNMKNNKELMVAMRGGGNQFGIVTKFTITAYPIGQVSTKYQHAGH
jgi:FAD/FMN-containing dehydrogenase